MSGSSVLRLRPAATEIRARFLRGDRTGLPPPLERIWGRVHGVVDPIEPPTDRVIDGSELQHRRNSTGRWYPLLSSVLQRLRARLGGDEHLFLFADTRGTVLDVSAAEPMKGPSRDAGILEGSLWTEVLKGALLTYPWVTAEPEGEGKVPRV